MKKAEEIEGEISSMLMTGDFESIKQRLSIIKQIQLDSLKEGMWRASRIPYSTHVRATTPEMVEFNSGVNQSKDKIEQAILTAAKNLTEKDL